MLDAKDRYRIGGGPITPRRFYLDQGGTTPLECYGVHEVRGRQTVEEFVRLEAAHDLNHLRQINRVLGG